MAQQNPVNLIAALVGALQAQNLNMGPPRETNIVKISTYDGTTDPTTWLEDFESAATANNLSQARKLQVAPAKKTTLVNTFVALEIPEGTNAQIAARSSWAKKGITTVGGVCDTGYTGDIIVQLHNSQEQDYIVQRNEKIAQLIILPLVDIGNLERVDKREDLPASG